MKILRILQFLILCCSYEVQGVLIYNNDLTIPKYPFELKDVFSSIFSLNTICIWNPRFVEHRIENLLKQIHSFHNYSITHVNYRTSYLNATQCMNNIVFNFDYIHHNTIFVDQMPSEQHTFLIIDTMGTNVEETKKLILEPKNKLFKVFWIAKLILFTEYQVYKFSSPHFPERHLEKAFSIADLEYTKVTDLKGKVVNIATFNCSLFSILEGPMNSGAHDGIEMRMMQQLALYLNMTPNYINAGGWGRMNDNGTWVGGLAGMLQDGEAEIGYCNIWNTLRYSNVVTLGPPWNKMYHTFIVPRPVMIHGYWTTIITLFQRTVWILLLVIFFLVTILFYKYKMSQENYFLSDITESLLTVFGTFLGQTHSPPSSAFGRKVILSWSIFSFFMASILNNMMISRLMVPHQSEKIDSVKDFVLSGYRWGEEAYSTFQQEVYFNIKNPWHKKMEQKFQAVPSEKMTSALRSRKVAFPVQRLGNEYVFIVQRNIHQSEINNFRLMKEPINEFYVSMIFSKLSPILEVCRYPLLRFFDTGLIIHWKNEVIRKFGSPDAARLLAEPPGESLSEFEPLTINNNLAAFYILGYGLGLSFVVFFMELFIHKKLKERRFKKKNIDGDVPFTPYFYVE